MLAVKMPMVFDFIKEQTQLDVVQQIIESPGVAGFKNVNNLPFLRQYVLYIDHVVNGRGNEGLVNQREALVDTPQLIFDGNAQIFEAIQRLRTGRVAIERPRRPAHVHAVDVAIPGVHGVAAGEDEQPGQAGCVRTHVNGRVARKQQGRTQKDRHDGPKAILKFLTRLQAGFFVGDKEIDGITKGDQTSGYNGSHGEKREEHQEGSL